MKQETQAILQVAKLVGVASLGAIAMDLALIYIPIKILATICGIFATGFFLKCMYDIALSDIKYKEKLEEMVKK
jgi:hypothetical protein